MDRAENSTFSNSTSALNLSTDNKQPFDAWICFAQPVAYVPVCISLWAEQQSLGSNSPQETTMQLCWSRQGHVAKSFGDILQCPLLRDNFLPRLLEYPMKNY